MIAEKNHIIYFCLESSIFFKDDVLLTSGRYTYQKINHELMFPRFGNMGD